MDNSMEEIDRWSLDRAKDWYKSQPWLCGFNYLTSSAVNSTEMWQKETFDPDKIDLELGWAKDAGFNTCRVFLQYLVWDASPQEFIERLDQFLSIADSHNISTMFIFFDDCAFSGKDPYLGVQDGPKPGIHNSQWTPSPGHKYRNNQSEWPRLEEYVANIISEFSTDKRVVIWDLYNERVYEETSLLLMRAAFRWARLADPVQPLTVCQWNTKTPRLDEEIRKSSDIISFHDYGALDYTKSHVESLKETEKDRPLVCTEWMARTTNSLFETHLPFFREQNIGCYCWGLIKGKTQTYFPWNSPAGASEPELWHHDVLHPDGKPYSEQETDIIRKLSIS